MKRCNSAAGIAGWIRPAQSSSSQSSPRSGLEVKMATGGGGGRGAKGASKGAATASGMLVGVKGSQRGRVAAWLAPRVTSRGRAASSGQAWRGFRR